MLRYLNCAQPPWMIVLSICFFDAVGTKPRTKSYTSHDPVAPFGKDVAVGTNPWACAQHLSCSRKLVIKAMRSAKTPQ